MSHEDTPDAGKPMVYQIRIKGQLGAQWAAWFGEVTLTPAGNGDTLLTTPGIDQAALYGLLRKVRDLGTPLISVAGVEPGPVEAPDL
jgi:hypothetical protein